MNMVLNWNKLLPRLMTGLFVLVVCGCYHMRAEPEPIPPRVFTVKLPPPEAISRIRKVLEEDHRLRILEEQDEGGEMITAPWHFATDTGFGQPAGGRKYYTQLLVETAPAPEGTRISLSPYRYEIRTTYAYGLGGQVETLNKHYPYDEYPGMFDNNLLRSALNGMAAAMQRACSE